MLDSGEVKELRFVVIKHCMVFYCLYCLSKRSFLVLTCVSSTWICKQVM